MRKNTTKITQSRLKEILNYDPDSGLFTNLVSRGNLKRGKYAGYVNLSDGYVRIGIDGVYYFSHRLVFLYVKGRFPKENVDHKNGNKKDNRFINLRECTQSQNIANSKKYSSNTSGYKGVYFHKQASKWVAKIKLHQKYYYLGIFTCKHQAAKAYNEKALELFGEFALLNQIQDDAEVGSA